MINKGIDDMKIPRMDKQVLVEMEQEIQKSKEEMHKYEKVQEEIEILSYRLRIIEGFEEIRVRDLAGRASDALLFKFRKWEYLSC